MCQLNFRGLGGDWEGEISQPCAVCCAGLARALRGAVFPPFQCPMHMRPRATSTCDRSLKMDLWFFKMDLSHHFWGPQTPSTPSQTRPLGSYFFTPRAACVAQRLAQPMLPRRCAGTFVAAELRSCAGLARTLRGLAQALRSISLKAKCVAQPCASCAEKFLGGFCFIQYRKNIRNT